MLTVPSKTGDLKALHFRAATWKIGGNVSVEFKMYFRSLKFHVQQSEYVGWVIILNAEFTCNVFGKGSGKGLDTAINKALSIVL